MNKILIVTYDFLPYSSSFGACSRVFKLSKYLVENGYEVNVLATKGKYKNYYGLKDELDNLTINYIPDPFKSMKDKFNEMESTSQLKGFRIDSLKKYFKNLLIPDTRRVLVNKFYKEAIRIIENEEITNVFISSPPHSIQILGLRLKKKYRDGVNMIVDYRDSWNTRDIFKKKNFILNYFSVSLEKKVLKNADTFIYASSPMLIKIENLLGLKLTWKSQLIMNGYLTDTCKENKLEDNHKTDKIKIGFFGSLISSTSSYGYIKPMLELIDNDDYLKSNIEFQFYGEIKIEGEYRSFVNIFESVDYCTSLSKMQEMDFLMIYYANFSDSEEVITGKFFDYAKVQKPFIVFSNPSMEAFKMVENYNLGFTVDITNNEKIKKGLMNIIQEFKNYSFNPNIDLSLFNYKNQFEKIVPYLK